MGLQNATNGGSLLNKIFVTNTNYSNGQVPTYNNGVFNPGTGGGGGTWGSITGTLSNQTDLNTALSNKQNTIATGTITQYFRGDLSLSTFTTDVRAVDLTGLTSTSGTISSADSILTAFGKALKGIADVNTRIDNLTPPNTGFFNGGENASTNRTLGNTTNYQLSLITNNQSRIKITGTGLVNVTDNNNEHAVPNSFVQPGSLVVSGRTKSFGGSTSGWNSNTAQLILEFTTSTEFAGESNGHGLVSFFHYEQNAAVPYKRMTIGRNMGHGRTDLLRNSSRSFLQANTDFTISSYGNLNSYLADDSRPNISIAGSFPHLFLISQGTGAGSSTGAIKLLTIGSDGIYRHLNQAHRNDGKYYSIAYYEGTDFNPHNNVGNAPGTIQYVMPSYSTSNVLGAGLGVGINTDAASIAYNLHVRGTNNDGSIAWGLNDGSRTETKVDANSGNTRLGKQSGFFTPNGSAPSNWFSTADGNSLMMDVRHPNGTNYLQIGAKHDTNKFFARTYGNAWGELVFLDSTGKSFVNGQLNIWAGGKTAVDGNYMPVGSLTVSDTTQNFGGGSGWNSRTAQFLLEFLNDTEIAGHDSGDRVVSFLQYKGGTNTNGISRLIMGRDMGWGRIKQIQAASRSFLVADTGQNLTPFGGLIDEDQRPTIAAIGSYPVVYVYSQGSGDTSRGGGFKFTHLNSTNTTYRHFNIGQRNEGKFIDFAFYEGTDFNVHVGIGGYTKNADMTYAMPGYSTGNVLGNSLGIGINCTDPQYHLHIRGTDTSNGTIGWGLNDGCRTELKNDANATDRVGRQSGFFRTNASPSNYFSGASNTALLIDCRLDNAAYGLQVAGNYDSDDLWTRRLGRTWYKILTTLNGWSKQGNDLATNSSDNKIGSTSAHNVSFIANNLEVFRLDSTRPRRILIDTNGGYGTASTPNYSFAGNYGEDCGMYYKSPGVLSFATNNTERLQIDNGNAINTYLPLNIAGGTQELRINGTKVLGTRLATISTISNTATGTEIATVVNAIINRLQTHGLIS